MRKNNVFNIKVEKKSPFETLSNNSLEKNSEEKCQKNEKQNPEFEREFKKKGDHTHSAYTQNSI